MTGPCPPAPRGPGRPRAGTRLSAGVALMRAWLAVPALAAALGAGPAHAVPSGHGGGVIHVPETHARLVAHGDALTCLATAIYHEARGESRAGQRAVASVILQRVATPDRWGDTVCEVIAPSQFTFYSGARCRHGAGPGPCRVPAIDEPQAWARAVHVARTMLASGPLGTLRAADHYHADHITPGWTAAMTPVGRVGRHLFYADPESRRARAAVQSPVAVSTKSPPAMFLQATAPAPSAASPVMCLPRQDLAARHAGRAPATGP